MQALVDFMSEIRGNNVKFDSNNLILAAGATSANETLIFCLAEPGDAFLLPTPYYPGYALFLLLSHNVTYILYMHITYTRINYFNFLT